MRRTPSTSATRPSAERSGPCGRRCSPTCAALRWSRRSPEPCVAALASTRSPAVYLSAAWRWARRAADSSSRAARLARGAGLIALGSVILIEPALVGRVAVVAVGVLVVLIGVAQLSVGRPEERPAAEPDSASPLLLVGAVAAALAVTGVAAALVLPGPGAAPAESAGRPGRATGRASLCDRRLDEVVFAGTHNSYAAAEEPGWLFASQRHGIERQLRDGIRAFLIDIHFGVRDDEERADPDRPRLRGIVAQQGRHRAEPGGTSYRGTAGRPRGSGRGRTDRAVPTSVTRCASSARSRSTSSSSSLAAFWKPILARWSS